nr:MAG TPA: hypothetical protein [Caudoviricetes sp.]
MLLAFKVRVYLESRRIRSSKLYCSPHLRRPRIV